MLVSFIVSTIDFRPFQHFFFSESSTEFPSSKCLGLTNSFFLWFRSLCCLKTVCYFSLSVILGGSRCFLSASFRGSCLLRRHSLSTHFSLKDISLRRLFVGVFNLRHRVAVFCKNSFHGIKKGDNIFRLNGVRVVQYTRTESGRLFGKDDPSIGSRVVVFAEVKKPAIVF